MVALEMADHGLDCAAARGGQLGDTADLAADPNLELVGVVVAAVALLPVDAADRNACELFEIGMMGPRVWPS
jgi:hypothetical protein